MAARLRPPKKDVVHLVVNEKRLLFWRRCARMEERNISEWFRLAGDKGAALARLPLPPIGLPGIAGPFKKRVTIRVAPEQKSLWEQAAEKEGREFSPWLRLAFEARAAEATKTTRRKRTRARTRRRLK